MTPRQRKLLAELDVPHGACLYGADVRVARALEKIGLVTITDEGDFRPGGRSDGERWSVDLTDKGREYARAPRVVCWRCEHEWSSAERSPDAKCEKCGADCDGETHAVMVREDE